MRFVSFITIEISNRPYMIAVKIIKIIMITENVRDDLLPANKTI